MPRFVLRPGAFGATTPRFRTATPGGVPAPPQTNNLPLDLSGMLGPTNLRFLRSVPRLPGSLQAGSGPSHLSGALGDIGSAFRAGKSALGTVQNVSRLGTTPGDIGPGIGLAGNILGLAGLGAGLAGADPRVSFGLGGAGSLLGPIASGAEIGAAPLGAATASGAIGQGIGGLAGGTIGAAVAAPAFFNALSQLIGGINRADEARYTQRVGRRLLAGYDPQNRAASQLIPRLQAGDLSVLPALTQGLNAAQYVSSRLARNDVSDPTATSNLYSITKALIDAGFPELAHQALRQGAAWSGGDPFASIMQTLGLQQQERLMQEAGIPVPRNPWGRSPSSPQWAFPVSPPSVPYRPNAGIDPAARQYIERLIPPTGSFNPYMLWGRG